MIDPGWKALVTLTERVVRAEMGDEAYDAMYDEDGNRRIPKGTVARPPIVTAPVEEQDGIVEDS